MMALTQKKNQNHHLDIGFDLNYLYKDAKQSIEDGKLFKGNYVINNEQRDVGVITGSYITQCHGIKGVTRGDELLQTHGHAGQSLAAFAPSRIVSQHTGDANDYVGKGLSGWYCCD